MYFVCVSSSSIYEMLQREESLAGQLANIKSVYNSAVEVKYKLGSFVSSRFFQDAIFWGPFWTDFDLPSKVDTQRIRVLMQTNFIFAFGKEIIKKYKFCN